MTFIYVQDEKQPKKWVDAIYLSHNSWDDYSYRLTFDAAYVDSAGKPHALGQVKVAFLGVKEGTLLLQGNTQVLSEAHYSLGQSQSYYETIRDLPNAVGKRILKAMRDIVLDETRYKRVEDDEAFRVSLMRYLDMRKIESFRSILKGADINSSYAFAYSTEIGPLLSLSVQPDSLPATNLHALIGRNGVGKTTLLANLAHAACTKPDELLLHPEYGRFDSDEPDSLFGNVVSVSYSAFDNFKVPTADGFERELLIPYDYIGLRLFKENRLKTRDELIDELIRCLKVCLFSSRKEAWEESLQILSHDPVFRRLPLAELAELNAEEEVEQYRDVLSEMSTGHQIVLLSIVEDDEVETVEVVGRPPLLAAARFRFQSIDQIDDIEEAPACSVADQCTGNCNGEMALSGSRAADENDVALIGDEGAGSQFPHQGFIDRCIGEVEIVDVLCERQLGDAELVANGAGLLLGDLRLQKVADDARRFMLPFDAVAHDLVVSTTHSIELQRAHKFENLCAFHQLALLRLSYRAQSATGSWVNRSASGV